MTPHPKPHTIHTPPSRPRLNGKALATVIFGILGSVAGVGVIVVAFVLCLAAGPHPAWTKETGYLLIAVAGFMVTAGSADLRTAASLSRGWRRR
jgi:zinc transporter ZupT